MLFHHARNPTTTLTTGIPNSYPCVGNFGATLNLDFWIFLVLMAPAQDETFAAVLFESSSVCRRGAMLYPHVGELTVSFNGGKDACVVARQGWSGGAVPLQKKYGRNG